VIELHNMPALAVLRETIRRLLQCAVAPFGVQHSRFSSAYAPGQRPDTALLQRQPTRRLFDTMRHPPAISHIPIDSLPHVPD
ncbi:MAG: hypothetical protein MUQ10_06045, partial [Anaerolineae bacterium]|nr:hypothetical protein [Anaerolineae bacterium]